MRNMDKVRMVEFPQHGDERGHLVIVEGNQDIPFEIKRVFYIYGSEKGVVRGCHANRKSEFVLINVAGTSKVKVKDGKGNEAIYCLNRPHTGIYLPSMVWKEMYDFSADSVLLVLASTHYDPDEYIRDYDAFCEEINYMGD
ncbi:FdtA/QdtA family cupin domain-containing protein [Stecheria sp. CLA-KB-P133]|uniref:FdtA/QdtA family cupin domain-containing protein n=2 Tax=Grylomicrobium aquisgranensis TaxID=2926318 RepID=A0AB35U559_9FIRM|nr:FdtA/QdtA family cupin domain-containing protein [Stecheria sp. CLA-KB-P133]